MTAEELFGMEERYDDLPQKLDFNQYPLPFINLPHLEKEDMKDNHPIKHEEGEESEEEIQNFKIHQSNSH